VLFINPLGAFYDIHGEKRELLFFYFVPVFLFILSFLDIIKGDEGRTLLTPEMDCNQTAIALPPVTSAVFLMAK
jgi:hypothetical protein